MRLLILLLLSATAAGHPAYDILPRKDGSVVFLDWPRKRLMQVTGKGELSIFADLGKAAAGTDPHTLAPGPDGSILVGATYQPRAWSVSAKGEITEFDLGATKKALAGDDLLAWKRTPKGLYVMAARTKEKRFRLLDPGGRVLLDVKDGDADYRNLYAGSFAVADDGTAYLTADHRVWKLVPGKAPVAIAGSTEPGKRDGKGDAARFHDPYGVVIAKDGALLVADHRNDAIRRIDAKGAVTTLPVSVPGAHALAFDSAGRLIVAGYHEATIRIVRIEGKTGTTLATLETR